MTEVKGRIVLLLDRIDFPSKRVERIFYALVQHDGSSKDIGEPLTLCATENP